MKKKSRGIVMRDLWFKGFDDYASFAGFRLTSEIYSISESIYDFHKDELTEQIYAMWKEWA